MKKKSFVPLFAVAFLVAVLSTGVFYSLFVGRLNSAPAGNANGGKVVLAARDLPAGTILKLQDLQSVPWAGSSAPAGAFRRVEDAEGKIVVAALPANEIVTRAKVGEKGGGGVGSGSMGIPAGMRAVSLQVHDSAGVMTMIRPGHRVDVQAIGTPHGVYGAEPQIRTIVENIEVLDAPPGSQNARGGTQLITLLATPQEAAVLGIADSTAKVRLALRNPVDQKKDNMGTVALGSLFRGGPVAMAQPPVAHAPVVRTASPASVAAVARPGYVRLLVRLARAGDSAFGQLQPQLLAASSSTQSELQVSAFRSGSPLDRQIQQMEQAKTLEVVSTSSLTAGNRREVGVGSDAQWTLTETPNQSQSCGLRIRFAPSIQPDGRVRLRVRPEVTTPGESGVATRQIETEVDLADGQSLLVRGLAGAKDTQLLWERLFPDRKPAGAAEEFLVFVTPSLVRDAAGSD